MITVTDVKAFRRIDDWRSFATIALDYVVMFAAAGSVLTLGRIEKTRFRFHESGPGLLASLTIPSWNQISTWLREMETLRKAAA